MGCTVPNISMETFQDRNHGKEKRYSRLLLDLPSDLLISILTFLEASDLPMAVCKSLRQHCESSIIWFELCQRTGKIDYLTSQDTGTNVRRDISTCLHKKLYYEMPCVPVDFPSITMALQFCSIKIKDFVITLMPGAHRQRFDINVGNFASSLRSITIRAAFPSSGAALMHYDLDGNSDMAWNQSCIDIVGNSRNASQGSNRMNITLENLQLLHYTAGNDIWGGNCAVRADGQEAILSLHQCTFQSDSGRGIVITNGAKLVMRNSVIHDCAATGLYIGDIGSQGVIQSCNIIRNGGGSRRPIRSRAESIEDGILNFDESSEEGGDESRSEDDLFEQNPMVIENLDRPAALNHDVVPPGHSGMYVETGNAIIEDALIAGNSLTGLSVVRGGSVDLSTSDITENGTEPVTVEDAHDLHFGLDQRHLLAIRGGIADRGGNNYNSRCHVENICCDQSVKIAYGGFVRPTNFQSVITNVMTEKKITDMYAKSAYNII